MAIIANKGVIMAMIAMITSKKKEGKGYNFTKLLVSVIMAKYRRIGTGRKN